MRQPWVLVPARFRRTELRLDTGETPSYTTPVIYILLEKAMGRMAITIIGAEARDIRFPTSRTLDGSDAIASSRDIFGCSKNRQNRIVENSTYPLDDFGFR